MTTDDREARARMRAQARYGFYKHLTVFFVINLLLLLINLFTSPGNFWAIWPLIGWGVAIALHALNVFVLGQGNKIVDRMTREEMRKDEMRKDEAGRD